MDDKVQIQVIYKLLWKQFCQDYLNRTVARRGPVSLCYMPYDGFQTFFDFLHMYDNDWMHGGMVASIYMEMADFFPECYPAELKYVRMGLRHDSVEIPFGDKLADGTYDKEEKERKEREYWFKRNAKLPAKIRDERNAQLVEFQSDSTPLFAIDKFEFVLYQLFVLSLWRKLLPRKVYLAKIPVITDKIYDKGVKKEDSSDEKYAKKIRSKRSVNICYAAFLERTKGISGREHLIGVMECAYRAAGIRIPRLVRKFYY